MNVLYFFIQVITIFLFSYAALRLGKEALIASLCVQAILANLFVLKQMHFLHCTVTCADALAIGSVFSLNLLREYFGVSIAKKAIHISFFLMVFFVILSYLHLNFIPSPNDHTQSAYRLLLQPAPRLLFASLLVFYCTQKFDLYIFRLLSRKAAPLSFALRTTICLLLSQLFDTILFSFLGLYHLMHNLLDVITISFLVKSCIILLFTPLVPIFKKRAYRV